MSVAGLNTREPRLELRALRGFPAHIAAEIRDRLLRFEFVSKIKGGDFATMELDNGDGALMTLESLALGVEFEVSWGYADSMTAPRRLTAKKIGGLSGHTRRGGGTRPVRESLGGSGKVTLELWTQVEKYHRLRAVDEGGARARHFSGQRLSAIIADFAEAGGYVGHSVHIEPPPNDPVISELVVPASMTDAQWLFMQANHLGYVFAVDEDGFHFHSRDFEATSEVKLRYFVGGDPDVISYFFEGDLTFGAPRRTAARGIDPLRNQRVEFTAGPLDEGPLDDSAAQNQTPADAVEVGSPFRPVGGHGSGVVIPERSRIDVFPVSQAGLRAQNAALRRLKDQAEKWKLKCDLQGNPRVRARRWIDFEGAGPLGDGQWYVRKATHTYTAGGVYTTKIDEATRKAPGARGAEIVHQFHGAALPDPDGAAPVAGQLGTATVRVVRNTR